MKALPVIRKAHIGNFLNRIIHLPPGSTKVNADANHEKITAYSASEPLEPGRNPLPQLRYTLLGKRFREIDLGSAP
jgi:hypothetical protein